MKPAVRQTRSYLMDLFARHGQTFDDLGVDVNNGFGDLLSKLQELPEGQRASIEADIQADQVAVDHRDLMIVVGEDQRRCRQRQPRSPPGLCPRSRPPAHTQQRLQRTYLAIRP